MWPPRPVEIECREHVTVDLTAHDGCRARVAFYPQPCCKDQRDRDCEIETGRRFLIATSMYDGQVWDL